MSEIGFEDESDVEETAGGYHGLYWGTVKDNEDPQMLGRVKANVPGITAKTTTWAFPMGMPGAGASANSSAKGGFFVPRKGAIVLVGFIHGKVAEPFYFCAHYSPTGHVPRIVAEQTAKQAPNVRVIQETETFEIYITDTDTEQKVVIQTIGGATMIEMDAKDGSIALKAQRSIVIEAPGVEVNGTLLTLKSRPVSAVGLSI